LSAEFTLSGLPLRARGVTAGYGGDPVIRDITVSADPGEVVSLVGPNGSGKSTLLKSLAGVLRVSAGTVLVGDRDLTNCPPEEIAGRPSVMCHRWTTCSARSASGRTWRWAATC
jgi:ABC-type cobalamin/Fe3+-siderophores transport system ATPase subunit